MKFSELNENNYVIFAIKNYENPHAVTKEDFEEDLKRFKWVKRLLKRYKTTGFNIFSSTFSLNSKVFLLNSSNGSLISSEMVLMLRNNNDDINIFFINFM